MLKWIIVGSFICIGILAMSGFPVEIFFCKEMLGFYVSVGIIAFLMKFDYWWKDIIKEIKEIANEE